MNKKLTSKQLWWGALICLVLEAVLQSMMFAAAFMILVVFALVETVRERKAKKKA